MVTTVERWFARLAPSTAKTNKYMLNNWLEWLGEHGGQFAGMGPDELVEWQKTHAGSYELLDILQEYVRQKPGRMNYKRRCYQTVRSLFNHNRAALPLDPGFRVRSDVPKVIGSLNVGELKRLLLACNILYRALYLSMFQGAMGVAEISYWSEHGLESLRAQLRAGVRFVKVDLPGRKKARNVRPYFTFLGRDAQEALRQWLAIRPDVDHPHIFINQFDQPTVGKRVQEYWGRKMKALGIVTQVGSSKSNRYGKNPHEMRDLFRSRWELSPAKGAAAEFFLGHLVDPLEYNKAYMDPDNAMRQYLQAEPYLNIMSQDPTVVPRVQLDQVIDEQTSMAETIRGFVEVTEALRKRIDELEGKNQV